MLYLLVENVDYSIHGLMSKKGEKDKISSKDKRQFMFLVFYIKYMSCLCLL